MRIHILAVPYDTALRGFRMGAGPERILGAGLEDELRAAGHQVRAELIEAPAPLAEIRTAFELNRALAERVRAVSDEGWLPVILAGNCGTAAGTLAGLGDAAPGVLWFDTHGDFNTPETTAGGFLDGMALSVVAGHCWTRLAATLPGFRATPEEKIVLLGTRDLDPPERERLDASRVAVLPPARVRTELGGALDALAAHTGDVYVHIDLDVLDPSEGRANALAAPDGLRAADMERALGEIAARFRVRAVALTAYDPSCDPEGRIPRHAASFLLRLLE